MASNIYYTSTKTDIIPPGSLNQLPQHAVAIPAEWLVIWLAFGEVNVMILGGSTRGSYEQGLHPKPCTILVVVMLKGLNRHCIQHAPCGVRTYFDKLSMTVEAVPGLAGVCFVLIFRLLSLSKYASFFASKKGVGFGASG